MISDLEYRELLRVRAEDPGAVANRAATRARRPLLGSDGNLMIIAIDHPARRILRVGDDPMAMANRRTVLDNTVRALRRPGVDGLLASPDIFEELLLLGELDGKVLFGSMNRGGLAASSWELDDRFTAHDVETISRLGLDGGKMLLRLDYGDPATIETISGCVRAIAALADRRLIAMVEPLPTVRDPSGRLKVSDDIDLLVEAVSIASSLGPTSAYTWLKLPAPSDPERMMAATTLPALLLGGDPGQRIDEMVENWRRAMRIPNVRGLVAGRSLLFPTEGDVERWVDLAVEIVHGNLE
ncbi:MAG: Cgl0159 family (beta/alpha)8-fold protein [Actinomycetota bacterium]